MNKKGTIVDIIFVGAVLFLFAIVTLLSYTLYNEFTDKTAGKLDESDAGKTIVRESKRAFGALDYSFLLVFVGLFISTVVTAFLIKSHPVFFVVSILLLFILIFSAVLFSNIFEEVSEKPNLENASNTYVIIPHIMDYLPHYIFGLIIVTFIIFFSRWSFRE